MRQPIDREQRITRIAWPARLALATMVALVIAACSSRSEGPDGSSGEDAVAGRAWEGFVAPRPAFAKKSVDANVGIVMDDGVVLRADVYVPALEDGSRAPGRFPVIVTTHCYGKTAIQSTVDYSRYGYAHVVVDVRGTGSSEGRFGILDDREARDAYNIVEWAAVQSFSDGNVGVEGFSYLGASSAMTAATRPPHLKAAAIGGAPTDIYRTFTAQGGHWASSSFLWFLLELTGIAPLPLSVDSDGPSPHVVEDLQALLGRVLESGTGVPYRIVQLLSVANGDNNWDSPFWQERATDVGAIEVPTVVYTGWHDLFLRDAPRNYRDLKLPPGIKQLYIGPWTHYSTPRTIGPDNRDAADAMLIAWFDHWLKRIDNGVTEQGPVTLWEYGTERWVRYSDWPLADTQYQRLYLSAARSGTSRSLNDGSLSAAAPFTTGADTQRVNPLNGLCSRQTVQYLGGLPLYLPVGGFFGADSGGADLPLPDLLAGLLPCLRDDDRLNEAAALTYTSAALEQEARLAGPIALTLRGSTSAADPTWVARLADVAPDGSARPISEGALVASRRQLDPTRTHYSPDGDVAEPFHWHQPAYDLPVIRDEVYIYHVEIWPTNWVLQRGHRLRLTIAGAELPHLMLSTDLLQKLGTLTVHSGLEQPSFLVLPLRKGDAIR